MKKKSFLLLIIGLSMGSSYSISEKFLPHINGVKLKGKGNVFCVKRIDDIMDLAEEIETEEKSIDALFVEQPLTKRTEMEKLRGHVETTYFGFGAYPSLAVVCCGSWLPTGDRYDLAFDKINFLVSHNSCYLIGIRLFCMR